MEHGFSFRHGSESQDSEEPPPPVHEEPDVTRIVMPSSASPSPVVGTRPTARGVENARKMLRAFCIQKKSTATTTNTLKHPNATTSTVLIGKVGSIKPTVKLEKLPDAEKIPKPPKPGQQRKAALESYEEQQKQTQTEIVHMKRKLDMVDLGIPLGLLCPLDSQRAMPTKAMPPIKTFLDIEKVDEIILEAKKAKAEGRVFKFDYNKFVPDYTNPFQRKKDEEPQEKETLEKMADRDGFINRRRGRRSSSRFDRRFDREYRKEDKSRHGNTERGKTRDSNTSRDEDKYEKSDTSKGQEAKVNLNDYLVCDSWSLENEDKASIASPHVNDKPSKATPKRTLDSPAQQLRDGLVKQVKSSSEQVQKEFAMKKEKLRDSPDIKPPIFDKLQPVMDSFNYEIDPDDDEDALDNDEQNEYQKHATGVNKDDSYGSPAAMKFDYRDGMDESFLESVINEIKQDDVSVGDDESQDKGLVEYDSPAAKSSKVKGCVTPEFDGSTHREKHSQRSDYSDGWRSTESRKSVDSFKSSDTGYRSSDTGYRSTDVGNRTPELVHQSYNSGRKSSERSKAIESVQNYNNTEDSGRKAKDSRRVLSVSSDKDLGMNVALENELSKSTVDSLEMWSFVLKICQPLLFRHDRNKCYKETRTAPKLWYTENPKMCSCVKDRSVVYEELEMCKCALIDRVYGCDQMLDSPVLTSRTWYPSEENCLVDTVLTRPPTGDLGDAQPVQPSPGVTQPAVETKASAGIEPGAVCDWEGEDKTLTPEKKDDLSLDIEYQRFMQAVWPEVCEAKEMNDKPSRSTTPVRMERKKKITDDNKDHKKGAKKIKLNEDWSQESEVDEEVEKSKKRKKKQSESAIVEKDKEKEKLRKRKLSSSTISSVSSEDEKKIKKSGKKKGKKKQEKSKRRRLDKKVIKKLKVKIKKKTKELAKEDTDFEETYEKEPKKKMKKIKQKKARKLSKKTGKKKKKRAKSSSSSDSSSSSSSESESEMDKKGKKAKKKAEESRKKKKTKKKKKKKRHVDSESGHSDELFDVNVLNNIKTERPEPRPLPRAIINVNTLQDDFSSTVKIKQEAEEEKREKQTEKERKEEKIEKEDRVLEKEVVEPQKKSVEEVHSQQLKASESQNQADVSESEMKQLDATVSGMHESELQQLDSSSNQVDQTDSTVNEKHSNAEQVHQMDSTAIDMFSNAEEVHHFNSSENEMHSYARNVQQSNSIAREMLSDASGRPMHQLQEQDFSADVDVDEISYKPHPPPPLPSAPRPELDSAIPPPAYEGDSILHPSYDGALYAKAGVDEYEQNNYEMYEHLAMAYQSDVAKQLSSPSGNAGTQRIETVVHARVRGEIKCDWRAGTEPAPSGGSGDRPSRWGLKPGEVNIVLTGGGEESEGIPNAVYQITSLGDREQRADTNTSYDEAYEVTYGASDRLQYGRCFDGRGSLDERIDSALRATVLGEVVKDSSEDAPGKGSKSGRPVKRVSFADGYTPGQDSDVEEPPIRKRKRPMRLGCAWPCPAEHPDHVSLWDALPPPPPPPGSPPPPLPPLPPPLRLLRPAPYHHSPMAPNFDRSHPALSKFMPPEPPPGLISFT